MSTLHALIDPGAPDAPALVLLHGRGSDERDLFSLGRELHATASVVSVRAPFPGAPWGYGGGWAWYRFMGGTTPEPKSFGTGQDALAALIDELPNRLGFAPSRIVIGGFSQGGTSALGYALRNPDRVSGVLVFSGFLADHPSVVVDAADGLPIWWGHGTADSAIAFAHAEAGWATLEAAGAQVTKVVREGMGHSIDSAELASARQWLLTR